jgi:hypothetical protein
MRRALAGLCALLLSGCNGEPAFPIYAPDACSREIPAHGIDKEDKLFGTMIAMCMGVESQLKEYLKANWSEFPVAKRSDCIARMKAKDPQYYAGAATYIGLRKCIDPQ